jgi:hypothetical protein
VNNTRSPLPYLTTSVSLILLILLSLSWELWIAPLREGGSWLALKALPLCLPLTGILKKRIYTYQYSSMLILIYFAEACMRLSDTVIASRICAAVSVLLCIAFFLGCLAFIKQQKHTSK